MKIIVPDASILIKWVLPSNIEKDQAAAYALRDAAATGRIELKLPSLWIYEVSNTLGRLYPQQAQTMIESLVMFGLNECPWNLPWLRKALSLMHTHKVSFYDAAYHALAMVEKGTFLTADSQYMKKVAGEPAVALLQDWRF